MLTPRRRGWLMAAGVLVCVSQLGASCDGGRVDYEVGFVTLGDRIAVYAPICPDESISGVRVHSVPRPGQDGDAVLLWEADGPSAASIRAGLIVLGEGFETVTHQPPPNFPAVLSVSVRLADGKARSDAHELSTELPAYPAGTPAERMTYETNDGRRSHAELREAFSREMGDCA